MCHSYLQIVSLVYTVNQYLNSLILPIGELIALHDIIDLIINLEKNLDNGILPS